MTRQYSPDWDLMVEAIEQLANSLSTMPNGEIERATRIMGEVVWELGNMAIQTPDLFANRLVDVLAQERVI